MNELTALASRLQDSMDRLQRQNRVSEWVKASHSHTGHTDYGGCMRPRWARSGPDGEASPAPSLAK